jgi:hypothetical protein
MKGEEEVDIAALTLRELKEEAGISKEEVSLIKPVLVVVDNRDQNIEICMDIELKSSGNVAAPIPNSHEHTELQWIAEESLSSLIGKQPKSWIPLSLYLIDRYFSR